MEKKTIKFRDFLVELVQKGDKDSTWRLFDDKDLQKGDEVDLINWNTGEKFADADLIGIPYRVVISEKTLKENKLELKLRTEDEAELVDEAELMKRIQKIT